MTELRPASQVEHAAWLAGMRPEPAQVRPGLWSICIPFPDNPLRYTISYVLRTREGVVLIDPGYGSDANWERLLGELKHLGIEPSMIRAVLVTHYHLDHWGGADRLAEAAGCEVIIAGTEVEWFSTRSFSEFSPTVMKAWYSRLGAPDHLVESISRTDDVQQPHMHDAPMYPLAAGEVVPFTDGKLRAVATPGHTDGHLSFVHDDFRVLIGGDHMLPTVSTNVSLTPFGAPDPLGDFLGSFAGLRDYFEYEVLPAHQYRYTGLEVRTRKVTAIITQRLSLVKEMVNQDSAVTPWSVAAAFPRKRLAWKHFDPLSQRLGLGEAAAYLAHLNKFIQ